jgi:PleD family two-component response regulator
VKLKRFRRLIVKVLIVDDSKFIRVRVNDILQQYDKRIELFEASNGKQCLSIINDEQPEIILLDVIMYELSGIDILKKIKELIESLSVKVIMISSVDDDATLKECFKFGASDFIRKPYEPNMIMS